MCCSCCHCDCPECAASRIDARLTRLDNKLTQIIERLLIMSAEVDALTAQVAANTDVESSAVQLLTNIAQQIRDAGVDRTKLAALATNLENSRAALAAAVVANTPATTP